MPRVMVESFVGPSNTLAATQADIDRTVNLLLESTAPGNSKAPRYLRGTPGLHPFTLFPDQPIRGVLEINNRFFVVGGTLFGEVFSNGTIGPTFSVGAIDPTLPVPVSMASNGTAGFQVLVVSSGRGYIYDMLAVTFTQITDPGFPAVCRMCDFMDGYFLALEDSTRQWSWSALEDGTSWDALDVAQRSEAADNIMALIRSHREVWLLGFRTSEVWWDTGDALNTFAPLQGVFLEHGAIAPFSVQRIADTLIWLGQDKDGACLLWVAKGYQPEDIGSFAVPTQLQAYIAAVGSGPGDQATALTFQMDGHTCYALTLAGNDRTWLYDVTMNVWTEWNQWDTTACVWTPKVVGTHAYVFGKHLMGDRFSGAIYECSFAFQDEQLVAPV